MSFVATLLAKQYLAHHYGLIGFDAARRSQNAPGIDFDLQLPDGRHVVFELKTTDPYKDDFGHQQRKSISKDLAKLTKAEADVKLFLVTQAQTFELLLRPKYQSKLQGITVVLLTTYEEFTA